MVIMAQNDLIITDFETAVLGQMIFNQSFFQMTVPVIRDEFFEDDGNRRIFKSIQEYATKYSGRPKVDSIFLDIDAATNVGQDLLESVHEKLTFLKEYESENEERVDADWMRDKTEAWAQNRAFYVAMTKGAKLLGSGKELNGLPEEMSEALALSFDTRIGHDYLEDAEMRYEFYHKVENKIPFKIDIFNKITKGGIVPKTLTCFMSNTTGGFKSGTMCDWAAFLITMGIDVLYITLEMSEEKVAHRIDANLMNIELDMVEQLPHGLYLEKSAKVRRECTGRLIIKEYPTSSAHAGHFRALLNELEQKKGFKPKVAFIDYLNICASSRQSVANCNSYTYVKSIAEELRGLGVERNLAIVSATQGKRDAIGSTDIDMSDVSESIGLPYTCDLMLGIIDTEELSRQGHLLFKQLKNRYGDLMYMNTFRVGVTKAKMQLYDIKEESHHSATFSSVKGAPRIGHDQNDLASQFTHEADKKKFKDFKF